jgi:hypothetical protein
MGGVGRSVSLSVVDRSRRYETTCVSYLDSRRAARRAPLATRPSDAAARRDRGKVRGSGGARSRVFARVRAATSEPAARLSVTAPSELDKSNAHARRGRVVGRIREKAGVATGGAPHPANRAVPIAMHGRVIRTFGVEGAPSRRRDAYLGHGYPRHRARGLALERGGTPLHNPSLCSGVSKRWSDVPDGSRPYRESTDRAARPPPKPRDERRARPLARAIAGAHAAAPTPLASRGAARAAREDVAGGHKRIGSIG